MGMYIHVRWVRRVCGYVHYPIHVRWVRRVCGYVHYPIHVRWVRRVCGYVHYPIPVRVAYSRYKSFLVHVWSTWWLVSSLACTMCCSFGSLMKLLTVTVLWP